MDEKNDKKVEAETAATAEKTAAEAEPEPEKTEGETVADEESEPEAPKENSADASAEAEPELETAEESTEPATDWKDLYARTLADFDNYRKRAVRDREELVKFATSEAVKDMLPTADNLALALDQAKDKEDPFVKGVQLAYEGFLKALKDVANAQPRAAGLLAIGRTYSLTGCSHLVLAFCGLVGTVQDTVGR